MAINTEKATILIRRGLLANFDPDQMAAGEWAVSIDSVRENQIIWMCFAPGVVKRMGTYEDFEDQIAEATDDIREQYITALNEIKAATAAIASAAQDSATAAQGSETAAAVSATDAASSATSASESASTATAKATEAASSAQSAESSKDAAASSAAAASSSATKAAQSETNASASANTATQKAAEASQSASSAESSKDAAASSAQSAESSKDAAASSASSASSSDASAAQSATNASQSASDANTYSKKAQSYAVGGTGTRPGEDLDNAKKYYEQAKSISESFSGALRPMGTVAFSELPAVGSATEGDMYNISDSFTTTADFKEGSGHRIPAGANVYLTADAKWDILAGTPVTGVKGAKETDFRTGDVNISPADIGAPSIDNAWILEGGTEIPDNGNLNDYTTVGNYYSQTGTGIANLPPYESGAFILKIFNGDGFGFRVQQIRFNASQNSYYRVQINFIWQPWHVILNDQNGVTLKYGTAIPENANLNDYAEPGNYYCPLTSMVPSIQNCPVADAFTMKVIMGTGTGYPTQIVRNWYTGQIAYRFKDSVWGVWNNVLTSVDFDINNCVKLDGTLGTVNPVSDLNGFLNGIGCFDGSQSNVPWANAWTMVVASGIGGTVVQRAFLLFNPGVVRTRFCAVSIWSEWMDGNTPHDSRYIVPWTDFESKIQDRTAQPWSFGHSQVLQNAGLGYWQAVWSAKWHEYTHQIAIGDNHGPRIAVRYTFGGDGTDSGWSVLALKSDLSSYATKSDLSSYAKKTDLSGYAKETSATLQELNSNFPVLGGSLELKRLGNVAFINLSLKCTSSVGSLATIAKVPEGYRPSKGAYLAGTIISGSTLKATAISIRADGSIEPGINMSSGQIIVINGCWIL